MRMLILGAALTALLFTPAYADEDCQKSWNSYDLNSDGYLKGEEAQKFRDDMSIQGITVGDTPDGVVSAKAYSRACEANFWEDMSEGGPQ
jgi:hypothetical protein